MFGLGRLEWLERVGPVFGSVWLTEYWVGVIPGREYSAEMQVPLSLRIGETGAIHF
jgi:hypothetical protein